MKYLSFSFFLVISFASLTITPLYAETPETYISEKSPGEYDEILQCIVDINGICEAEYVEEILDMCKDCDIPTPDIAPPSAFKVCLTRWGIALGYKVLEHPYKATILAGLLTAGIIKGTHSLIHYFRAP